MKKIVKVCHLTSVHPVSDVRIFHKECKTLSLNHYEVVLIAPSGHDSMVDNIKIKAVKTYKTRWERITKTTWELLLASLRVDAHVYHFHDPELIPVGILLKLIGKKVIYDVHEDYPHSIKGNDREWMPNLFRVPVASLVAIAERFGAKFFSGIVAATPTIAANFPLSKTVIVQNFPITEVFILKNDLPYKSRPHYLVYTGAISPLRGCRELIETMAILNPKINAKLKLAGRFDPGEKELEMRNMPGWEKVDFLGWQPNEKVAELMGQCRVGLVTLHPTESYLKSYPLKLFEYMCAGIPVVASDFPLWREIIEGADCGLLVDPLDPVKIAEAIKWLLENPDEAEAMGRRGKQAVEEKYNWDIEKKKLLTFYESLD